MMISQYVWLGGGNSNICYFYSTIHGEMIQFDFFRRVETTK